MNLLLMKRPRHSEYPLRRKPLKKQSHWHHAWTPLQKTIFETFYSVVSPIDLHFLRLWIQFSAGTPGVTFPWRKNLPQVPAFFWTKELHRPVAENCAQSLIMAATATRTHGLCTFLAETKCKGIDGIMISWILTHVDPFGVVPPDVKPRSWFC